MSFFERVSFFPEKKGALILLFSSEYFKCNTLCFCHFWPTYLYLVLLCNVPFGGLSWTPSPTYLIWDVINESSPKVPFLCVQFLELSHIRRDLSQSEKKMLGAIFILRKDIGVGGWSRKWHFFLTLCSKNVLT